MSLREALLEGCGELMRQQKIVTMGEIIAELQKSGRCRLKERLPLDYGRPVEVVFEDVERVARKLKHLSEPNKLKILLTLYRNGPLPVCIISHILKLDQTLVSHHLRSLREDGLVDYEQVGKFKLYKLTNSSQKLLGIVLNELDESSRQS